MILSRQSSAASASGQFTYTLRSCLSPVLATFVLLAGVSAAAQKSQPLVDENYSLKADREALEALRKDIPVERRNENDEKAFMDQMMSDITRPPAEIRNKFQSMVTKKRNQFSGDMTKQREDFSRKQKTEREEFMARQKTERESFAKKKVQSEERTAFYDKLEAQRKDFYTVQREKRDEFDEEIREKRKNFDDYVRSRQDEFNQLHRDYTKGHEEHRKFLADSKKQAEIKKQQMQKQVDSEYEPIRHLPPTYLQSNPTGE